MLIKKEKDIERKHLFEMINLFEKHHIHYRLDLFSCGFNEEIKIRFNDKTHKSYLSLFFELFKLLSIFHICRDELREILTKIYEHLYQTREKYSDDIYQLFASIDRYFE